MWASLVAQLVKNLPAMQEDPGSIPGSGRSPEKGKGYPLQYSGLENAKNCIVHEVAKSRTRLSNFYSLSPIVIGASLVAQMVKNLPAMQEIPVQSLGREYPLEKGIATQSSILGLPCWLSR